MKRGFSRPNSLFKSSLSILFLKTLTVSELITTQPSRFQTLTLCC